MTPTFELTSLFVSFWFSGERYGNEKVFVCGRKIVGYGLVLEKDIVVVIEITRRTCGSGIVP